MSDQESKTTKPESPVHNTGNDSDDNKPDNNSTKTKNTSVTDGLYTPIVTLPEVEVNTLESDEIEIFKMKCKLYRFHTHFEEYDSPEWKERGVGDLKLMQHKDNSKTRVVMRRDKTLKLCANHYITSEMKIVPLTSSDKALIWNTLYDYSDGVVKPETLCIRFESAENAIVFKDKFTSCVIALKNSNGPILAKLDALKIEETKEFHEGDN